MGVRQINTHKELAEKFQQLHTSEKLLVLPNAWDAGSAVIFEKAGFQAIGTTSAGIAYSLGYPDGEYIDFEDVVDCSKKILRRTTIPISVDIETGFTASTEGICQNVKQIIMLGVVGINIEDGILSPTVGLTDIELQVERIKAIAELKDELDIPFIINARADVYWLNIGEEKYRLKLAIERANAYVEAGADCIFIPASLVTKDIKTLVQEIGRPINLIATAKGPTTQELESLGVARLSLGSGPVRASVALTQTIANELKHGSFNSMLAHTLNYQDTNKLFS